MAIESQFRVLVTGDRHWGHCPKTGATDGQIKKANQQAGVIVKYLDRLKAKYGDKLFIIEGGAQGADTCARMWAISRSVPFKTYPAEWSRFGRGAGPIRNKQMLQEGTPHLIVAFHAFIPNSRGTKDMVRQAREAGFTDVIVGRDGKEYLWDDTNDEVAVG